MRLFLHTCLVVPVGYSKALYWSGASERAISKSYFCLCEVALEAVRPVYFIRDVHMDVILKIIIPNI